MKKIMVIIYASILFFSVISFGKVDLYVQENNEKEHVFPDEGEIFTVSDSGDIGDSWPMYRHDPKHTGYSIYSAPETNNLLWDFSTGDQVRASPAIYDNKVYVGSYDYKLYCLNSRNGSIIWHYTAGSAGLSSSPAVVDGKVYIGSFPNVYCLNATNGSKIWEYSTGGTVASSPTIYNSMVFIASSNQKTVYCLNAENGSEIWTHYMGQWTQSSPAVYNGKVYIGGGSKVFCLNANNGNEIWNHSLGGAVLSSSPALDNNYVYIGSYDNRVYCLNAENGSEIWSYETEDHVQTSPAVANGKIYVGSNDNNIYCLNAENGSEIWIYETGGYILSSPAVAVDKVYIGSSDKKLYCLNVEDGIKIWDYQTNGIIESSPAIADGRIYVGSNDNKVYCFGDEQTEIPDQPAGPTTGYINIEYTYTTSTPQQPYLDVGWDWNSDLIVDEWTDISTASHVWTQEGIYDVRVKVKYSQGYISDWSEPLEVTITALLPELLISTQSSVMEGASFEVTVSADHSYIENVNVEFDNEIKKTDSNGHVTFTSPEVTENTDFIITATLEGYDEDTTTITVLNLDLDEPIGFVFGTVLDTSTSLPIENVKIEASGIQKSWSTYTDDEGRYLLRVLPGTYVLKASKVGYKQSIKSDVTVNDKSAIEVNIILEITLVARESTGMAGYIINSQIREGRISAEVEESHVTLYSENVDVEITNNEPLSKGGISLIVAGEGPSTIIAIYLPEVSDDEELIVTYDGIEIHETTNLESFFNNDNTNAEYVLLQSSNLEYVLCLRIPEFSEHTITITSLIEAIGGPVAILTYIVIAIIATIVFLGRFYLRPVYLTYFRKKRQ